MQQAMTDSDSSTRLGDQCAKRAREANDVASAVVSVATGAGYFNAHDDAHDVDGAGQESSGGANQRETASAAHQLATPESRTEWQQCVGRGRLSTATALAAQGRSGRSFKIQAKHFSASVNRFTCELDAEAGNELEGEFSIGLNRQLNKHDADDDYYYDGGDDDDHGQSLNCVSHVHQQQETRRLPAAVNHHHQPERQNLDDDDECDKERDRGSQVAAASASSGRVCLNSAPARHRPNQVDRSCKQSAQIAQAGGRESNGHWPEEDASNFTNNHNDHHKDLIDPNNRNSSFWTRLSNLSRSIKQQQQEQQQQKQSQVKLTLGTSSPATQVEVLAPEVLGYLESKKALLCNLQDSSLLLASNRGRHSPPPQPLVVANSTRAGAMADTTNHEATASLQDQCNANEDESTGVRQRQQASARRRKATEPDTKTKQTTQQADVTSSAVHHQPTTSTVIRQAQVEVEGDKLIKIVESQQATINHNNNHIHSNSNSNKMRLQHQRERATAGLGEQQASTKEQVKLSIAMDATNTTTTATATTTNTNTTTTTTHSSSASSLSSCILSDSSTAESDEVRLKWGKKMDFLLSIIGFAVDLANIWRFPYLVYKNGGGVFLIPYLIMLIFGGIPLFFLELCLGQFVKKGPITVWNKICPYMKGVGYCSILISWYVSFYYNILIAWSVYFIYRSILSFGEKMPWEDCDNLWNSRSTCVSISQLKELCSHRTNETLESCRKDMFSSINVTSPASEFFVKELSQIDQSSGLEDMGYLRYELVICTMIVYLLHYFSLFRGLETSGKVVWVTATAPYMILSILLVRGLFLPGASMGIEYYLSPRLEKLADPHVWIDAAGQVFYSIGVGFGVHLTYASFNSHNNNCYRDCLMTSAVNALTSVYSGLVVFVYLGYMATNLGIEIDKVASEGYSLVFEVYPEALTTLPFARFWSILFFIMLLTLGIDSAMGGLEAVITGVEDEFKFAKRLSRAQLTGLVIVSSFLPALISCTQGGAYTLFWFDIYSAGVSLLFSALFETIGVVYCYGLDKFILNIESMLGRRPQLFYILCWKYISPLFLLGIIFMSIYTASVPVYRGYTFPLWSIVLGWCLAFSSVAAVPIVAIWTWYSRGNKAISVSPSKSPRKPCGAYSVTSGGGGGCGSRNASRKSTPSHHGQCKSMSVVNYTGTGSGHSALGGGQMTTISSVINLPPDNNNHHHHHHHHHHHDYSAGAGMKEEML